LTEHARRPVAVAIPTHNRREHVLLAIHSALNQTRPPSHVLVICDGCTDGTAEAVRAIDSRVEALEGAKRPGYGYVNRNLALVRARELGAVLAWCGDDDLLLGDHLERLCAPLDAGAELVRGAFYTVLDDERLFYVGGDLAVHEHVEEFRRFGNALCAMACLPQAAERAGGWRDDPPRSGDRDLWRRMLSAGARTASSPLPSALYFETSNSHLDAVQRLQRHRDWAARIADPIRLARLRALFMPIAGSRLVSLDATIASGYELREERLREHLELRRALAELDAARAELRAARAAPASGQPAAGPVP
jgi:glycosyltransferase involved in cell wall biosynthesis